MTVRGGAGTRTLLAAALLLALSLPAALWGQEGAGTPTPFTAAGLGYPVPPLDARGAALGGGGVGLLGGSLSVRNPADLVGFADASLGVSLAPEGVRARRPSGAGDGSTGRSRVSVMRAVVPLGAWRASVGFASELDQDWSFRDRDTLEISTGSFPFEERRENDGGVSTIDLSVAREIGPLSLGVSYQRLTGELRQALFRRFEISLDSTVSAPERVNQEVVWSYGGDRIRAGAGLQLGDRVRVSGAYAWTGRLTAEADSAGRVRRFDMPSSATVGASARPLADLLVSVGGGWTGWSETSPDLGEGRARDTYWGGGGMEFSAWGIGSFPLILRAGGRYAELPFVLPGSEPAEEAAVTLGLGTAFAGGLATVDLGLELGRRGDAPATGMEESFSRFTFSATIRQ